MLLVFWEYYSLALINIDNKVKKKIIIFDLWVDLVAMPLCYPSLGPVIIDYLYPASNHFYPDQRDVLQEDNAPIQSMRLHWMAWWVWNGVNHMLWTWQSVDCNWIECQWETGGKTTKQYSEKKRQRLRNFCLTTWYNTPWCKKL